LSVFTLLLVGVFVLGGLSITSEEATASDTVIVSAEVEAWVTISIDEDSLALGNMVDTAGDVYVVEGQTNVNAGTNHPDGWSMTISGANGGLENSGEDVTISTVTDKESLTAGVDGYGALAVHDTSHDDSVSINTDYDGGDGDDEVNSINTTEADLATATEAMSTGTSVFDLHVHAASDDENPVGTYEDTITLTITAGTT